MDNTLYVKVPPTDYYIDPSKLEFLRLPPPGQQCPICGLSRSALNDLILPSEKNGGKPPVKSFCLRQKGAKTGIRLVDYQSLRDYIRARPETFEEEVTDEGA